MSSVWRAPGVSALLGATVLGFAGYAALMPVAPLWAVHGGAGEGGAGLVNGVLMLFTVLTQPFVPGSLRRFGWGPVLVAGMVLLGLPSLLFMLGDGLGTILVLSAIRGLGFGVLTVTGSAAVAELVPAAQRGRAVGAYGLAIAGAQVVLLPAAPWVAETLGYWVVFVVGALPLLGVVPAWRLAHVLRQAPEAEDTGEPVPWLALLRPMALLLGVTLAGGALLTFTAQMSSSASLTLVGLMVMNVSAALTRWRVGALADRFGAQPFIWPLVLTTVVGMSVLAGAVRDPLATAAAALLVGLFLVGLAYGALQNLTLVVTFEAVSRRHYGQASAVWNIGFDAGTGLGSVLVGMVAAGTSFSTALLVAAAFSLATLPLALLRPAGRR